MVTLTRVKVASPLVPNQVKQSQQLTRLFFLKIRQQQLVKTNN